MWDRLKARPVLGGVASCMYICMYGDTVLVCLCVLEVTAASIGDECSCCG